MKKNTGLKVVITGVLLSAAALTAFLCPHLPQTAAESSESM